MSHQSLKEKWALGSLALNGFLTLLKFIFAIYTGSLALMAEAIHSLSDLIVSLISLVSVKISSIKAKEFPYGLYKVENIAAVVIALFLFFTAYEILKEAFFSHEEKPIRNIEYAIGVMLLTLVLTFVYSQVELRAAKKLNSPTLEADAHHIWADFLSSLVVIIGLVGVYFGYNIDKYAAAIVSLFIIHTGWEILVNGIKSLLDVSLDKKDIEKIRRIVYEYPIVVDVKNIRGRSAGSYKFVEMELLLHNYGIRETHKIVDDIEEKIKKAIPNVESVVIHYEPIRQEGLRIAFLTDSHGEKIKDFKTATKVVVVDIGKNFQYQKTLEIDVKDDEKEIGNLVSKMNIDIVVAKNHPENFETRWTLAKAGVVVWETDKDNFDEALKEVIKSWKEYNNKNGEENDKQNISGS